MKGVDVFSRSDVVTMGFEATCTVRGAVYFWHRNFGVRIEKRTGRATLLTDPAVLPDGRWVATRVGARELEAAGSKSVTREPDQAA